jgi:hypothetical protein
MNRAENRQSSAPGNPFRAEWAVGGWCFQVSAGVNDKKEPERAAFQARREKRLN